MSPTSSSPVVSQSIPFPDDTIRLDKREDGIAIITLDRPARLNALSGPLLDALAAAVEDINADPDVRVFLIQGAPRPDGRPCFSAGVDVQAFADGQGVTEEQGFALTNRIDDLLKPSIAVDAYIEWLAQPATQQQVAAAGYLPCP